MPLVYASTDTSRCRLQDSRPGWIRYFLSCRALSSPTTCRFIPALSGLPTILNRSANLQQEASGFKDFGDLVSNSRLMDGKKPITQFGRSFRGDDSPTPKPNPHRRDEVTQGIR